jgi:hypothetical protein
MLPLSVFTELPRAKVFLETRLPASSVLGNPYRRAKGNSNSSQRDEREHRTNYEQHSSSAGKTWAPKRVTPNKARPLEQLMALSTSSRTHPVLCNPTCTDVHLEC